MSSELLTALLLFLQAILQFRFGDFLCRLRSFPRLLPRAVCLGDLLQSAFSTRHFAGQVVTAVSFAIQGIFSGIGFFRLHQQPFHFRPQMFLFLLNAAGL